MNICVEGPDNSGKSVLVKALSQIYDRPTLHATKMKSDADARSMFEAEVDDAGRLVLDRSQAISDYIYSKIVRKQQSCFDYDDIVEVAEKTLLIICLPPKDLVLGDRKREEMPGVRENHEALYDEYVTLAYGDHDFHGGSIDGNSVFVFDYTKHHMGDVIDWITDVLGGPLY